MTLARCKARLTCAARDANTSPMDETGGMVRHAFGLGALLAGMVPLAGCISVNAPSEPIVIELNVNIKQEVLYRLVDSAQENIAENPEIF